MSSLSPERAKELIDNKEAHEYNPLYVSEVASLLNLCPEAREAMDGGQLCRSNAYVLAKKPTNRQKELLPKAIEMKPCFFVPAYHRN